jgi:stringent starvation protein B
MKSLPSTRPYLIRAMHEWCMDHGFTPYVSVLVDASVRVPKQFVQDGQIVLNISTDATGSLVIGNDFIDFKARFGGVPQDISVPIERVQAIYAKENGQGMAFPVEPMESEPDSDGDNVVPPPDLPQSSSSKSKPALRRIK